MKRTTLSLRDAAWLADTFARNRARFGGWSMEAADDKGGDGGDDKADDGKKPDGKPDDRKPTNKAQGSDDKPLGDGGEKALRAEREARKALESQLADLKKGLLSALGGDDGKDADDGDALTKLQQRIDDMQHENVVLALANEHRITDADDLALLRGTRDAEALKRLAARLAPAEDDGKGGGTGKPKPDRSQGGGDSADTKPSVARGREMFASSRGKKAS